MMTATEEYTRFWGDLHSHCDVSYGARVSRDDWVFPNWDPTRDYTETDYQALSG